jgi:hypothetical protein
MCGTFPKDHFLRGYALANMVPEKFQIPRDSQALCVTIVTKDRLPVFRTDASCSVHKVGFVSRGLAY